MTRSENLRNLADALDEQLAVQSFVAKCSGVFPEALVNLRFKVRIKKEGETESLVYLKLDIGDDQVVKVFERGIARIVEKLFKDMQGDIIAGIDKKVKGLEESLDSDGHD